MAGYITSTDLSNALGGNPELQRVIRESTVLESKIAEGINWAESLIDSFLQGVDGFPGSPVHEVIIQLSIDLSIYMLYLRSWGPNAIPESSKAAYDNALLLLGKYRSGELSLVGDSPSQNLNKPFHNASRSPATEGTTRIARLSNLRYL